MSERVEFKQPTTPAEVLRLGKEFKNLRDTRGFLLFRDLLVKRYQELAVECIQNSDPRYSRKYWRGRCEEIQDILLIVDLAVMNAKDAVAKMNQEETFKDQDFPFQSGSGTLA